MKKIFTLVAAALCSMSMMAKDYTCPLVVNLKGGNDMPVDMPVGDIKVNVDEQKDGKYTMSLLNFNMNGIMSVGNIVIKDVEATKCGNVIMLNAAKDIQITKGDDENVEWMGPGLGNVNILLKGELKGDNFNAYLNIPLADKADNMIVGVKLGKNCNEMGQLPNAGFENFHEASYSSAKSQEPNGWHSFMSSTGSMASMVSAAIHTYASSEVRENAAEDNKQCVKIVSTPVKVGSIVAASANGTITTGRLKAGSMTASSKDNCSFLDFSSADVDANGDPFYAVLNNKPDAMKVWVKFKAGDGNKNPKATISALLTNGNMVQDPEDDKYAANIIARANNSSIESKDEWQEITIPFTYDNAEEMPKAALVTMSTCAVPGGGSKSETNPDVLYVDDVEMVYNADVKKVTMDGEDITNKFDEAGELEKEGYNKNLDINNFQLEAIGAGAYVTKKITTDGFNTYVSFTVTSNDLKNCVTRTITLKNYTTGIKNVETLTLPNGVKAIYNMAGQQVTDMQSGQVYIVKYTNGETKKMIKK